HYENFPVVSKFLKKDIRKYVAAIYVFARTADDIVDEGDLPVEKRIDKIDEFKTSFEESLRGERDDWFWQVIRDTILKNELTVSLFTDLLDAFKQDLTVNRFENFAEICHYCKRSANPIGRLLLELHGIKNEKANKLSDKICTALQLINFYQDLSIDFKRDRLYIPLQEISDFKLKIESLDKVIFTPEFKELMKYQVDRADKMIREGAELLTFLNGRFRFQIAATVLGGSKILDQIKKLDYNTISQRPSLEKKDFLIIFSRAILDVSRISTANF
ncbi:MAG: squalene synthase HpnC, partial [Ignavibacteriaceae bacterium]|nr:squalene synthase HpnC [Ignavibacteriaceae bacterium]